MKAAEFEGKEYEAARHSRLLAEIDIFGSPIKFSGRVEWSAAKCKQRPWLLWTLYGGCDPLRR